FEFLLLGYGAYMTFFAFCKKAFPEISDQTVARMVAGIEAEIFRPDEVLRRLARRAVELGVDDEFKEGRTAQAVMAALEARGAAGLRSDDRSRPSRLSVRRGAQVLLRALVHEPLLQQDPRVRGLTRGARVFRARRGRVPAHALRGRSRDHRPHDLLVERLAAA